MSAGVVVVLIIVGILALICWGMGISVEMRSDDDLGRSLSLLYMLPAIALTLIDALGWLGWALWVYF